MMPAPVLRALPGRTGGSGAALIPVAAAPPPPAAQVASSSAVAATFTATAPSGVQAGDLLVALCYDAQGASQSFTAASGWSAPSANASDFIAGSGTMYVFYKYATGSDSYAFSGSGTAADVAISVLRITGGPAAGDPFDAIGYFAVAAGFSAATMPGAFTYAAYMNDLAACFYGGFNGQTVTSGPAGMTAATSAQSGTNVSLYPYWQGLSNYGTAGSRPVTWSSATAVMCATVLVKAATPAAATGTIYTQRSNATLLGGETHTIPNASSMTQSLTTAAIGDLVIMFIHWTGGGLSVTSVSSSHVTWAGAAAVTFNGSQTGYHAELWYGTVTSVATANVTVNFSTTDTFGTELGFDSWGASAGTAWSVQATGTFDSGSTTNRTVTSAPVTATGNGLYWSYDVTDIEGFFGLTADYGYYFTVSGSNGSPISWQYALANGATYQSSAWTESVAGRWNAGAVIFAKT